MNQTETQKSDKGFTLIELLIVIVILGVLAAVIVFRVSNVTDSAETNACEIEVRAINTAIQAYYAEEAAWPTLAQLVPNYLEEVPGATTASGGGSIDGTTHVYSPTTAC